MVGVSQAFHDAVKRGEEQRGLIWFDDGTVFTNEDISVNQGLAFDEPLNTDTDLTIGGCPSSTLQFAVINDNRLLNDFGFGWFNAAIGVMVSNEPYDKVGNVSFEVDGNVYSTHDTFPYLRKNGGDYNSPTFPVASVVYHDGVVYCIGYGGELSVATSESDTIPDTWGELSAYTWEQASLWRWDMLEGQNTVPNFSPFLLQKLRNLAKRAVGLVVTDGMIYEYRSTGDKATFEYCPLGRFRAERPSIVNATLVQMDARDQMQKFDVVLDDWVVDFPLTIGDLYQRLCEHIGVSYRKGFINEDRMLTQTIGMSGITGRELLSTIAEAACGYARFDREGVLEIAWFTETDAVFDEHDYVTFVPGEYSVAVIDKLRLANSDSDFGTIVGTGENAYIITDNPCLWVDSQSEGVEVATPIFDRLSGVPPMNPSEVSTFADWSYQAGDVVTVSIDGIAYRFPIYNLSLNWTGSPMMRWENTGNPVREPLSAENRQSYNRARFEYQLTTDVQGLRSLASELQVKVESLPTDDDLEALTQRITTAESEIAQTAREVDIRVTQTEETVTDLESSVSRTETELSVMAGELAVKVDSDGMVQALNLSTEGLKIKVSLLDVNGFVSLNGDTVIGTDGTLTTRNMVATNATITGTFEAPHTYIGSTARGNQVWDGLFFFGGDRFNGSIQAAMAQDSYGEYHLETTTGTLYIDTSYNDILMMRSNQIFMNAFASDETLIVGRDSAQPSYADVCFYPESSSYSNPRGNCGTPAHPWDTCTADQFFSDNGIKSRSSRELKEDIELLGDMGDVVDHLEPVQFRYRHDGKHRLHYGLIFEDVEPVAPILCEKQSDKPQDKRIGYDAINIILLKEMQSVRRRLERLEGNRQ